MNIDIREDLDSVKADLARLSADLKQRAIARAINRTAQRGSTAMVREITREFAILSRDVRPLLKLRPARGGLLGWQLTAEIFALKQGKKRGINVMRFGARSAPGSARKLVRFKGDRGWARRIVPVGGGVAVEIKKGGGRKVIAHAFVGNQGRTVFIRTGKERLPIKGVSTVDVRQMFNTKRINRTVVDLIRKNFPEILRRELRYYVERFGR